MTSFDPKFFREFKPTDEQIQRYLENAENDLSIAEKDAFLEVRFTYAYSVDAGTAFRWDVDRCSVRMPIGA